MPLDSLDSEGFLARRLRFWWTASRTRSMSVLRSESWGGAGWGACLALLADHQMRLLNVKQIGKKDIVAAGQTGFYKLQGMF